jgi:hypothetical protein
LSWKRLRPWTPRCAGCFPVLPSIWATGLFVCCENKRNLQGTMGFGLFFRKAPTPQTRSSAGSSLRSALSSWCKIRLATGVSFQATVLGLRWKRSMHAIYCCGTIHALAEYLNQGDSVPWVIQGAHVPRALRRQKISQYQRSIATITSIESTPVLKLGQSASSNREFSHDRSEIAADSKNDARLLEQA